MPGRKYNSPNYRYGFNGKEKDQDGEFGSITNYDYGFRIYNPAVGRFLSVDPLTANYPWYTPYQFAGNKPIVAVDLDGLEEITIHSAWWVQKLLEVDFNVFSNDEIVKMAEGFNNNHGGNHGGYVNEKSREWAIKNYESPGMVTSVKEAPPGQLTITGFTNATSGDVIKFTIYSSIEGGSFIEIDIPDIRKGLGAQLKETGGIQYVAGTYVLKYSGFGKLSRALENYMEGADPFTGEPGSTSGLIVGGVTDLATSGIGGFTKTGAKIFIPAGTNALLNVAQETLENLAPEELDKIGISREVIDIGLSLTEPNKVVKTVEVIANLIQAGYLTVDVLKDSEDNVPKQEPKTSN